MGSKKYRNKQKVGVVETEAKSTESNYDIHPNAATGEDSSSIPGTGLLSTNGTSNTTPGEEVARSGSEISFATTSPQLADKFLSKMRFDFLPFLAYLIIVFLLAGIDSWQKQFAIWPFIGKCGILAAFLIVVLGLYGGYLALRRKYFPNF